MDDRLSVVRPAQLVLLNGPSGVGKTTVARAYAARHPMTLVLDLDQVRSMLGGWEDDLGASGLRARELGLALVEAQLRRGSDVIAPQLLTWRTYIDQLGAAAERAGAVFQEVVLDAPPAVARGRFEARSAALEAAGTIDVQAAILSTRGGLDALPHHHELLQAELAKRAVTRIEATEDVGQVVARLERVIEQRAAQALTAQGACGAAPHAPAATEGRAR